MDLTSYYKTGDSISCIDTPVLFKQEFNFSDSTALNKGKAIDQTVIRDSFVQKDRTSLSHENRSTVSFVVHEKVTRMIFEQLYFPLEWEEENISRPNLASKKTALEVCKSLFDTYSLMPDKISPTKEEGVYMRFDYSSGRIKNSLIIEVYNTLEIAAIVTNNDTKKVKFTYDIHRLQFNNAIQYLKKIK
ncbi:MAG: hypothetical protein V3U87_04405 [Methylococcaceae bacterium]